MDETFGSPVVKVAVPNPDRFRAMIYCSDAITIETYSLRRFGIQGTQLRLSYMVLTSLSNTEAERLIDEFEAQPDEMAQVITR